MFKIISDLFKKKTPTVDNILLFPEGKRYYRDSHIIRKNHIDEDVQKIIYRLSKFGHKSFLVGGCVRDILLGRKPKDFDIVTSATPNQLKNIFNNCRIVGRRFKIVHVIFKNKIIEVSTFRSLPDHRLEKPEGNKDYLLRKDNNYGNPKEDAARRDFTINSLYFDLRNESIIDFVGGYDDIQAKILKVIGDPDISFKEDPVRMLRAVKFAKIHGLEIDKATQKALKKNRFEILKASTSRMLEEYNKIFRTWKASEIFKGLAENFLLDVLFSEALEHVKRQTNWREDFLETSVGKRLAIADRLLSEREEINSTIFYSILFSDIVNEALKGDSSKNMIQTIKTTLEPIFLKLEHPRREREKIVKVFASQQRFFKSEDRNKAHSEVFRNKDFFYEAFMLFKINAMAETDEDALQKALYWEISSAVTSSSEEQSSRKKPPRSNQQKTHKSKTHNSGHKKSVKKRVVKSGNKPRNSAESEKTGGEKRESHNRSQRQGPREKREDKKNKDSLAAAKESEQK
ncbi:MAG: polynucleotide adenylyltransferase PcnB [Leptospiraceae bacterium]|nr:polynucleotide adenylyltransferase PcnB [Leptospiraceae bacterium]MCP5499567.1 polynucleotide adenylyltransferase PcnB [Leptospiraceae bacterium]